MNVEVTIHLDKFAPRWYQEAIWDAIENKGYRKVIVVLPRRAGKDLALWNLAIRQCLKKTCLVQYVLPTFGQANRAVFSAITSTGERFIDYIPKGVIKSINASEMKVVFHNNSVLQCLGGDTHNTSIRGTNPFMVILSEYAYMSSDVYNTVSPILAANQGIVVMATTPYGKNHFWQLFQMAKELPDWFVYLKTVDETQHISYEDLQSERNRLSPELFSQEYYCDFSRGVDGSIFGKSLNDIIKRGQVTHVAYEPGLLVYCAIDIGVNDPTTIIWYQVAGEGTVIRIIDCYSNRNVGLDHYVEVLQNKPYWGRMGKLFAPHDIKVREWGGGAISRYQKALNLGIQFTTLPQTRVEDSIENCLTHFPKFWIDETKCRPLLEAINNYHREYDEVRGVYKSNPVKDWSAHYCFVGDTQIQMAVGTLVIKDIKEGMFVKTPFGLRRVLKIHKKFTNDFCDIEVGNSKITCTPEHKLFTTRGLLNADALRYNDVMEYYTKTSEYLWKMIYGYCSKKVVLEGFKKTILSLKMGKRLSIMHMLIDGMDSIIRDPELGLTKQAICIEQCGSFITGQYQASYMCIIKIITSAIMPLRIWNWLSNLTTKDITCYYPVHGVNLVNVHKYYLSRMIRPKLGILVQRELNGTKNMQQNHCQLPGDKFIHECVSSVQENIMQKSNGQNFVLMRARVSIGWLKNLITKNVLVLFVLIYTFVINTLLKKHVVKNVRVYQLQEPKEVYDLTVEDDNCYYANGYLVSNCDALRYMCEAIHMSKTGMTAQEFDRKKHEALYGTMGLPRPFAHDPRYDK